MRTKKIIKFNVYKPEDYKPIARKEQLRIQRLITREVLEVANRFDGVSSFVVTVEAKGNA